MGNALKRSGNVYIRWYIYQEFPSIKLTPISFVFGGGGHYLNYPVGSLVEYALGKQNSDSVTLELE